MQDAHSVVWQDRRQWYLVVVLVVAMIAAVLTPMTSSADESPLLQVIVEKAAGADGSAEQMVQQSGGTVLNDLPIINGFTAEIPQSAIAALTSRSDVLAVTPDGTVQLMGRPPKDDGGSDPLPVPDGVGSVVFGDTRYASSLDGSMYHVVAEAISADAVWTYGDGTGVTVALIDSGVVPVLGLTSPDKVINGPDLSFESQSDNLRYLDTFGHGTHMAGIIAGNETGGSHNEASMSVFQGVAPGANILSVKVADREGSVDVSQVIAAIDWVVQHRNDNGMNVRVINLSFGTDSTQSYLLDPLAHAVEMAVGYNIVVVVAAGNDGNVAPLRNPALDPFVIAVGALNTNGTKDRTDDFLPVFSNCGTEERHVDVVAPGVSIVSLRSPGSYVDTNYPEAAVAGTFFKGTGSSQAAAVVSGAAALLISKDPGLDAFQVKNLLMKTATPVADVHSWCQGAGLIDVKAAHQYKKPVSSVGPGEWSLGNGSLDAARGSFHLEGPDGVVLEGEQDIFRQPFDAGQHATAAKYESAWDGGTWNGVTWSGVSWSGLSWSGLSWSGVTWSGVTWSGLSWSGLTWSDMTWNGLSWSGLSWSGLSWSGLSWSASAWSGVSWDGARPNFE